ncbi:sulfite exporter TauE/SafE family protein [Halobacteriovorax sp. JY17]|uniref:sulfite exporter TauE/SafE family protein n=1 Tax=Halobacteriovorax sp. JY17 TaxID=2014617 RepID=UPI000C5CF80A|nr:sulfite exporter TauE/SafE family protein [Halobacteriovorax sp. JY17]PIK15415.1 MAG: hypothetical protein CES88_01480 [Halobacteriovorax sp. JY17]
MDQLTKIQSALPVFAPMLAFMIGLTGSIHCIGMCGGLVMTVGKGAKSNAAYQFGRLSAYLFMAFIAMLTSTLIQKTGITHYIPLLGGVFLGLLFVFWGAQSIRGKKFEVKLPLFITKFYQILFSKFNTKDRSQTLRGFSIGALSLMLPCGFLYGVLITLMTFQSPLVGFLGVIGFWLGTLPAMVFAPGLMMKVLGPIQNFAPKASGFFLICLGTSTVSYRLWMFYSTSAAHCH